MTKDRESSADSRPPASRRRPSAGAARLLTWAVLIVCVGVMPLIGQGLKHVQLKNDVESWLPKDDPSAVALAWYHEHFEHHDRMLASWDTSSISDSRVDQFAEAVRSVPGIASVTSPNDVIERMDENRIERSEAIERLEGVLVGTGGMKVRLTEIGRSRKDALIASIESQANEDLSFPIRIDKTRSREGAGDAYDFQLAFPGIAPESPRSVAVQSLITELSDRVDPRAPLIDEIFFAAGSPVAVSISVSADGAEELGQTIAGIRDAAASVGIGADELRMGGAPVAGAELNAAVVKSARNTDYPAWMIWRRSPVLLSAAISVVLAFVMLRSVRLALIVLCVGLFCVAATVSIVPPTGGSMSMVLIVMPNLLMVLTMSGAIHLANYWKHAAADATPDEDREAAVAKAVRQARGPCSMASFTTAIGLASLLTSLLTPVKDFGFYSAIGCGLSLVMVLVVVPALLRVWPGRAEKAVESDRTWWYAFGELIVRNHVVVTSLCVVAFVVGSAGLYYFKTETKVVRYFPPESRIVQDYNRLEESLAGIVPVTIVVGFHGEGWRPSDLQDQIRLISRISAALEAHPEISGTISLADFIPPAPGDGASRRETMVYNRKVSSSLEDALESDGASDDSLIARTRLDLSTNDRGRDVSFKLPSADEDGDVRLGQEIWKITSQVSIMSDIDYEMFLREVDAILLEITDDFQRDQQDSEQAGARDVNYLVTGTVPLFLRTQQAVLESLIRSFGLAFGVIAVVMMIVLKGFRAGLITMLPNLLPVGVVFGAVSWYGIAVDIGTMITASVALGIAVDGTLHLISWFRDRLSTGEDPHVAIAEGLTHCGPAMWQTSAIVGFGMLALLGADLLLISRFGWLMASLIAAALIADLVFLPSLLAGPLGRLIASRVSMRTDTVDPVDESRDQNEPTLKVYGA